MNSTAHTTIVSAYFTTPTLIIFKQTALARTAISAF